VADDTEFSTTFAEAGAALGLAFKLDACGALAVDFCFLPIMQRIILPKQQI
jgi:hypothetical protein